VRSRTRAPAQHPRTASTLGRRAFLGASAALALGGCGSSELVLASARRIDNATIDADPLAVMPADVVMLTYIDLQAAYRTSLGGDVALVVQSFVPLGADANFSPARDTTRFFGGLYAMQGLDYCAVIQGRFDTASIARAADARVASRASRAMIKTRYADCDLYTVGNTGFVALTQGTLLAGNETGLRRALDRLRRTRLKRDIPGWMLALLDNPAAQIAIAGDFGVDGVQPPDATGQSSTRPDAAAAAALPALESAARTFPVLDGLRAIRSIGSFAPPGLNLVGAMTYDSEGKADAGSAALSHVADFNPFMNLLVSIGLGASITNPQVARSGRDVAFIEPLDERVVRSLLAMLVPRR
jgi:hypothetical protein